MNPYKKDEHNDFIKLMKRAGCIRDDLLINARLLPDRGSALSYMPSNAIVAEIGVAYGGFSRLIISCCHPKKFYAIDIFSEKVDGFWGEKRFALENTTHYQYYSKIFESEISEGKVELCQGLSWEVLQRFEDNYFDFVYVDAAHDYESVKKDIEELKKKVKNGGYIQFNDYIHYDYFASIYYGVVPAVNEFVNDTESTVEFYCLSSNGYDDIVVKYNKRA